MAQATKSSRDYLVMAVACFALCLGTSPADAQTARMPRVHVSLAHGRDCYIRGEYEQAAAYFDQADKSKTYLTAQERQELARFMGLNNKALQARTEGAEQVRQAEIAVSEGRLHEAQMLLRAVTTNQFLRPQDKAQVQQLAERINPSINQTKLTTEQGLAPIALARLKLQQSRGEMAKGNFRGAEELAHEALQLGAAYSVGEDTPVKVLEDLSKIRSDPKKLLTAARNALQRGELERAEQLAQDSERASTGWMPHLWGDSPSKVLRDVQSARTRQMQQTKTAKPMDAPGRDTPRFEGIRRFFKGDSGNRDGGQPPMEPSAEPASDGTHGDQGNVHDQLTVRSAAPDWDDDEELDQPRRRPTKNNSAADSARKLVRQARQALDEGDIDTARELANNARERDVEFNFWEDSPERILADARRAGSRSAKDARKAIEVEEDEEPEDPRSLVKQARAALRSKKYDKAEKLARRAKMSGVVRWGLFEDNPEKIFADVAKARSARDKEQAETLMAEARKALDAGNLEAARTKAEKAQSLHGSYSVWDFTDRPDALLAEIAKREKRKKRRVDEDLDEPRTAQARPPRRPTRETRQDEDQETPKAAPRPLPIVQARDLPREQQPGIHMPHGQMPTMPSPIAQTGAQPTVGDDSLLKRSVYVGESDAEEPARPMRSVDPAPYSDPAGAFNPSTNAFNPTTNAVDPARHQALQLMGEANQLQAQGNLIEARHRLISAQKANASFGPDEVGPKRALMQLVGVASNRIDSLVQEATDFVATAGDNIVNYERAEANLIQASELAVSFGLDTQAIESKWAWVRQQRQRANNMARSAPIENLPSIPVLPTPPRPQTPAGPPNALAQHTGMELIEKARIELTRGELSTARRLAEEAFKGNYGVRDQAEAMLRNIDVEEKKQGELNASRALRSATMEIYRKNFKGAAALLVAIDTQLLPPDKQSRVRELLQLPEIRQFASPIQPVSHPMPSGAETSTGMATVGDMPRAGEMTSQPTLEQGYAQQVQAMQEVQFQKLREDGLRVQREATDLFKQGDDDHALEMLQEHLEVLEKSAVDSAKVALLKRPVENRLLQLRTLKSQRELEQAREGNNESFEKIQSRRALAEQHKQEEVKRAMDQYHAHFKEGKYEEAEMCAMQALELDPDNYAASAAAYIARTQRRQSDYNAIKKRNEENFVKGLNAADDTGIMPTDNSPLIVDPETSRRNMKRQINTKGDPWGPKSEKDREIERRLLQPITLDFQSTPLAKVVADVRDLTGLNIVPDVRALQEQGISLSHPLDFKVEGMSLKSALSLLLDQAHLTYIVKDEAVQITTPDRARGKMVSRTYQVADLIIPVPNIKNSGFPSAALPGNNTQTMGMTPMQNPASLPMGQAVGSGAGNMTSTTPSPGAFDDPNRMQTLENQLIKLITNTVAPSMWSDVGGPGTIDYYPLGMALVINITEDIQEQIADLLATLRRLQDNEVTIEVRFITLDEGFFERIGVDFGMNILTNNTKWEPQLTSGQFVPPGSGLINQFRPDGFLSGLTPAGTFTNDLDIPIRATSYPFTIPPYGGYTGIPGGGLSLGLAFLSDIQVFLFLEAVQGDRRSAIMQAPKLTMFNGQSANMTAGSARSLIQSYTIQQSAFGFVSTTPTYNNLPSGVNLNIQPVVSADRRFVRMNVFLNFTEMSASTTAGNKTTAVFQQLYIDGQGGPPPVEVTAFLPDINTQFIDVQTTVMVPDSGTVIIGGLKLMREARSEFGPPVLSKIPYINRLFKNVGYGRDSANLMLMITPRVISNEEEEVLQTGYDSRRSVDDNQ